MRENENFWKSRQLWGGLAFPAILAFALYLLKFSSWVSEYIFARGITRWLTSILTWLTNWIPLSVAELLIYLLPVLLLGCVIYCIFRSTLRRWRNLALGILSVVLWGLCLFELLFVIQFGRVRLEKQLGYRTDHIAPQELYEAACEMRDYAAAMSNFISYTEEGYSVWPGCMGISDSNQEILSHSYKNGFKALNEDWDLPIYTDTVRPKTILASEPFSYTGILGVYIPFTGEANLNVAAPPFIVAVSAAHEQAHQKGYSREDEANFLSILVCFADYNEYINYSGALYAFRLLYNALYNTDKELYYKLMADTPLLLKRELQYYNNWIRDHENQVTTVMEQVNDAYLKVSGGEGTVSYSQAVELLIGWYRMYYGEVEWTGTDI